MVVFILQVKADLENCAALKFPEDHIWCMDIKRSDGEDVRERITVDKDSKLEVPNTKNNWCNFLVKFEDARQVSTINIVDSSTTSTRTGPLKNRPMTMEYRQGNGEWQDIVAFECRGTEPIKYYWKSGYMVERESDGKDFDEEIDLEQGEWCGYDEKTCESVMVSHFQARFVVAGKK